MSYFALRSSHVRKIPNPGLLNLVNLQVPGAQADPVRAPNERAGYCRGPAELNVFRKLHPQEGGPAAARVGDDGRPRGADGFDQAGAGNQLERARRLL